jgi:hypothetical protein
LGLTYKIFNFPQQAVGYRLIENSWTAARFAPAGNQNKKTGYDFRKNQIRILFLAGDY